MTSEADRQRLLQIARDAIVNYVEGASGTAWPVPESAALQRAGGAFVTIHRLGELRGCIGHIEADRSVVHVVADCAVAACSADPRFPPVNREELSDLEIEVSLLGPLEPVAAPPAGIEVGRHGLVVEQGSQRGLLLPQVALEWSWDREMFLAQTCHKAGLPRDVWKRGAKVWRFDAEVFGEAGGTGKAGQAGKAGK
jgi:uncharacterized protein